MASHWTWKRILTFVAFTPFLIFVSAAQACFYMNGHFVFWKQGPIQAGAAILGGIVFLFPYFYSVFGQSKPPTL